MTIPSTPTLPRLLQFRLSTLLIVTAWAAIVSAALKMPFDPWLTIVSSLSVISVLLAAILVIYRTGRTKAAATGYLIFAVGFVLLKYARTPQDWSGMLTGNQAEASLPMFLFYIIHGEPPVPTSSGFTWPQQDAIALLNFYGIYQNACATLLGLLGSLLAQYLHATQPPSKPTSDTN